MIKREFSCKVTGDTAALTCYDYVGSGYGGFGAVDVKAALDANSFKNISIRINSPGGDAFEGVAIYNLLRSYQKPVAVYVDGLAASAASIIAMAGDSIEMGVGSTMMIHNAATIEFGFAADMRKTADTLDTVSSSIADIYVARTGGAKADIQALMDAETWMTAQTAVDSNFASCMTAAESDEDSDAQNSLARSLVKALVFKNAPAQYSEEKPMHSLDFYKLKLSLVTRRKR